MRLIVARQVLGMAGWAVTLPLLKRMLSLRRLVRLLAPPAAPTPRDPAAEAQILRIVRRLYHPARHSPGTNCLERSLVLYRYLVRAGAKPHLVIGMAPPGGAFRGHAWVEVAGHPVGETRADLAPYQPLVVFGPAGEVVPRKA
ncbi:MAG: lasso peptide biosynthesis B2 protein [Chloroflexota bacterium]|nr:lasso peptide biosynthesis B2 protein [Chloroflexota bacterium]